MLNGISSGAPVPSGPSGLTTRAGDWFIAESGTGGSRPTAGGTLPSLTPATTPSPVGGDHERQVHWPTPNDLRAGPPPGVTNSASRDRRQLPTRDPPSVS